MNLDLHGPIDYEAAWAWLHEFPGANFDDYGPQSFGAFMVELAARESSGEEICCVRVECVPVGLIGYAPITPKTGMFHGICFARQVHRTGIAQRAVRMFLEGLWAAGVEKVSASYFADNEHIHMFFKGFGAVEEGLLRRQTYRGRVAIDVRVIAIFKD